jgi:DNA-binding winged helix-turn-helix (wHTH) protein
MSTPSSWRFRPFRLDLAPTSLWRHAQLVALPPKPLAVLTCLVAHAGEVVTKEALLGDCSNASGSCTSPACLV